MATDPELPSEDKAEAAMNRNGRIRLVLQRLDSGYYQRLDVLRDVAERILRSS